MGFIGGGSGGLSQSQNAQLTSMPGAIAQNTINILVSQAAASLVGITNSYAFCDYFSDSNGYKNTINTGTTTAGYDSTNKLYGNAIAVAASPSYTTPTTASAANSRGLRITPSAAISVASVTKSASCTATVARIINNDTAAIVGQANFSGNTATFSSPVALTSGQAYRVTAGTNTGSVGADGSSYTVIQVGTTTMPQTLGSIVVNAMIAENGGATDNGQITAINYAPTTNVDKVLALSGTLSFTPGFFQVTAYNATTSGTGSITATLSFDGTHTQTAALNTPTPITNAGTALSGFLNFNAGASAGSASCGGYVISLW